MAPKSTRQTKDTTSTFYDRALMLIQEHSQRELKYFTHLIFHKLYLGYSYGLVSEFVSQVLALDHYRHQ